MEGYKTKPVLTCAQRAMISANRDTDFGGYSPRNAGSTIFSNESISCSCGVAHRTKHCSDLGLELQGSKEI
jgi:hypothetical protein